MELDRFELTTSEPFDDSTGIREVVEKYLTHLKWFVLSILIFCLLTFFKLRYEVPKYNVNSSILIKEQQGGSSIADLSEFEDLGLFSSGENSLENEIEIIKSRKLVTKTVEELKLNIKYFIKDTPYDKEIFPNLPIILSFKSDSTTVHTISSKFEIFVISKSKFEFFDIEGASHGVKYFNKDFNVNLGNEKRQDKRVINIKLNEDYGKDLVGETVMTIINPINVAVSIYMEGLEIEPINEQLSNVLILSIEDEIAPKGIAFINNLVAQYNADGINDNNLVAQSTTDFLDERLTLISNELKVIESTASQYKTNRGMMDIGAGAANIYLQSSSITESEIIAANTQLELVEYMLGELNNTNLTDPLPSNVGLSDISIVGMINEYNNLILKRSRVLESSTIKNPLIIGIDSQLIGLKNNLKVSLNNLKSSAQIQLDALIGQKGQIGSKIASVPKQQEEFKDIIRQQETKNALYIFLLQKREESIISNAVSIDKAKIIDSAYSNGQVVSPKKIKNYLGAIILGFLIPFLIIYIKDLLDTKVHDERDIKKLKIPYIGDIPLSKELKQNFIKEGDSTNIAEAFRYVRTNISFMLDKKEHGKTIFITSTLGKEGKTFSAINLASSLAISNKKVILLAMDLRAPKISKYLGIKKLPGVTNYIMNDALTLNDIIDKGPLLNNFDIIHSGDIPPNPVELLMSKRVEDIFDYVKSRYDYIIVDTAPVGMVTDTIQISKYADVTIYVIKSNYLDKRMLHIPEKLYKENKLHNMSILINGSDHDKGAYGYGYGYGYGKIEKKPWYKFFS